MRRYGPHGLVFLLAALCVMALTAPAASAFELRRTALLVGGTNLTVGVPESMTGGQESTAVLSVPEKDTEIRCEKTAISEGSAENETLEETVVGKNKGLATLTSCKVFTESTKKESASCTKAFSENSGGKINIKFIIVGYLIHSGEDATLVHRLVLTLRPASGSLLATLVFGGSCALPKEVEVSGGVSGEMSSFSDEVKSKTTFDSSSEIGKEINEDLESELKFGSSHAFLQLKAYFELTGTNKGKAWGTM